MVWTDPERAPVSRFKGGAQDRDKADIRDEIEFHLAMATDEAQRNGLTFSDARLKALDRFGNLADVEQECLDVRRSAFRQWRRVAVGLAMTVSAVLLVVLLQSQRDQSAMQADLDHLQSRVEDLQGQLADLVDREPPKVVETLPRSESIDVDPAMSEIRVTFNKPMLDASWSWCQTGQPFPTLAGPIRYAPDGRTCVMPVKLDPDTAYVISVNSSSFQNFKDDAGIPAIPYVLRFKTSSPVRPAS
ncbi:MAG: permease prefix domain 1-containing protein [Planctomycetota bacterium]